MEGREGGRKAGNQATREGGREGGFGVSGFVCLIDRGTDMNTTRTLRTQGDALVHFCFL